MLRKKIIIILVNLFYLISSISYFPNTLNTANAVSIEEDNTTSSTFSAISNTIDKKLNEESNSELQINSIKLEQEKEESEVANKEQKTPEITGDSDSDLDIDTNTEKESTENFEINKDPDTKPTDHPTPTGAAVMLGNLVFSRGFISEPAANSIYNITKSHTEDINYVTTFISQQREHRSSEVRYWYFDDNAWRQSSLVENVDYTVNVNRQVVGINPRFYITLTIDTNSDTFVVGRSYWFQFVQNVSENRIMYSNLSRINVQKNIIPATGIELSSEHYDTFIDRDNNPLTARFSNPETTDELFWNVTSPIPSVRLVSPENLTTLYTLNQKDPFFTQNINSSKTPGFPTVFTAHSIEHPNINNSLTVNIGGLSAIDVNPDTQTIWRPSRDAFNHMKKNLSHYQIKNITSKWLIYLPSDADLIMDLEENEAEVMGFTNLSNTVDSLDKLPIPSLRVAPGADISGFKVRLRFIICYTLPDTGEEKTEYIYSNLAQSRDLAEMSLVHVPNFSFSTNEKNLQNNVITSLNNETPSESDDGDSVLEIYAPSNQSYSLSASISPLKNISTNEVSPLNFSILIDNTDSPIMIDTINKILDASGSQKIDLAGEKAKMLIEPINLEIDHEENYQAEITWTLNPKVKKSPSL